VALPGQIVLDQSDPKRLISDRAEVARCSAVAGPAVAISCSIGLREEPGAAGEEATSRGHGVATCAVAHSSRATRSTVIRAIPDRSIHFGQYRRPRSSGQNRSR
jgi:hypothetical protein